MLSFSGHERRNLIRSRVPSDFSWDYRLRPRFVSGPVNRNAINPRPPLTILSDAHRG